MKLLEGKKVADNIKSTFITRIERLEKEKNKRPHLAVLAIEGDDASNVYIKKIEKNCQMYGIGFTLLISKSEEEFIENFNMIKENKDITGIMFGEPLPQSCKKLMNEILPEKDVEGVSQINMGRLLIGENARLIPCTSKAVVEVLDYYNIDLKGKKVAIVGRSNIVGKPLIPQLLKRDATVTICHSKTKNLEEELKRSDVIVMAIGRANFLKKEMIKNGAILIDVGINVAEGKIVGDIDFEDVKDIAGAITPVPGGIGIVTNAILIDNVIKSMEAVI